mmetsp:Transcript_30335/g.61861  ORF Transcript_30335/g.61861 Transcript_30335/m.61861 type:complete len:370 (-) Transcript_30335:216-1325(-)|eukprot:CAMPEP_0183292976 /NCGR_PEP_ID=MMETSP0160_2-20130417/1847_1 /TAXON_ID=2839 ORGANISM="Odontella Sinensis, Strain Grunow 1884" /NCGR_SAMPLE_ID=MMETSP0160_2 /ASSEMBLY_ACC=CAM_ASM_000250 /LENGTH=369 /DNA_ID=CAMNT_0025454027 /DNA_START=28 /DNA_END=1137 /DNA_ORIENTATION=-
MAPASRRQHAWASALAFLFIKVSCDSRSSCSAFTSEIGVFPPLASVSGHRGPVPRERKPHIPTLRLLPDLPNLKRCPPPVREHTVRLALGISGGGDGGSALLSSLTDTAGPVVSSLFAYGGNVPFWQAFGLNAFLFGALSSKLNKMLTLEGLAHSLALGTLLWTTLGWRGWTLCVMYLFLGQAVTKVKFEEKQKKGIAEARGGRRGPENVWGSAFTGLICAACSVQGPSFLGINSDLFILGYVASLATKLADTFASEIGKAYGKTTFLITTFERVEPGTEGAVSAEGTLAAMAGGFLLSLYGLGVNLIDTRGLIISTIAAFLATNAESFIGATLQEKKGFSWMTNEVVNFINTLIGAGIAILVGSVWLG